MIVCGCDMGSRTAKAVLMADKQILSSAVTYVNDKPEIVSQKVFERILGEANLSRSAIHRTVGTGYGAGRIPFADESKSEIACHAKSAKWLLPSINMVIDIGGQDAKVMRVNEDGDIVKYVYNDICATGSGRFLEMIADVLGLKVEDIGHLSLQSKTPLSISSQCVIFAETEIISLINKGCAPNDILAGLHQSLAQRVAALAKSIILEENITFTGGAAKNIGLFQSLENSLGVKLIKMEIVDPQLNGAIGAALFATAID